MKLDVDKQQVLKFLGYTSKKVPKIIEKKLDQELNSYDRYIEAEYHIKKLDLNTSKQGSVVFSNQVKLTIESSYLYKKLKDVNHAYVVVYTVGKKIEEVIEEYSNNSEMMKAIIVDKIGVVALDDLRDKIVEKIEKQEYPKVISSVAYPSQGDFNVEYQKSLFDLFKDESKNIEISQSSQFSPLKTVILVYAIGYERNNTTMCEECDNKCHIINKKADYK